MDNEAPATERAGTDRPDLNNRVTSRLYCSGAYTLFLRERSFRGWMRIPTMGRLPHLPRRRNLNALRSGGQECPPVMLPDCPLLARTLRAVSRP